MKPVKIILTHKQFNIARLIKIQVNNTLFVSFFGSTYPVVNKLIGLKNVLAIDEVLKHRALLLDCVILSYLRRRGVV